MCGGGAAAGGATCGRHAERGAATDRGGSPAPFPSSSIAPTLRYFPSPPLPPPPPRASHLCSSAPIYHLPLHAQLARLRRRAAHAEGALHRVGQRVGAVEGCLAQLASSATRLQHGAATVRQAVGEAAASLREARPDGGANGDRPDGPDGDAGLAAALAAALAATDLLVADTAAAAAEGASAMNDAFVAGQRAAEREAAASAARGEVGGVGGGGTLGGGDVGDGDDDGGGCGADGSGGSGGGESNGAAVAVEGGQSSWREASGRVGGSGDAYQIGDATRSALRWVTGGARGRGSS